MKNIISKTASLVIIATLLISNSIFALTQFSQPDEKDKLVIKIHAPVIKAFAEVFDLSNSDLAILESHLNEVRAITLTFEENELDLVFDEAAFSNLDFTEDSEAIQLEDWMFTDLSAEEEALPMEAWMYADDYYSEEYENGLIEDWMMVELVEAEPEMQIEEWMFSELSSDQDAEKLESWMFNTEYYSE